MVQAASFWSRCKKRVTNVLGLDANLTALCEAQPERHPKQTADSYCIKPFFLRNFHVWSHCTWRLPATHEAKL